MKYLSLLSALFAATCVFTPAVAHPASPLAVHVVSEQLKNAKIVPDIIPVFNPQGLLQVNYTILPKRVTNGQVVSKANTTSAPIVSIRTTVLSGASGGAFNTTDKKWTLAMIDGNYVGSSNGGKYNLHWLANGFSYDDLDDNQVFMKDPTDTIIPYAAPAPPSGTGPHRYIFLLYEQPGNFNKPAVPTANSGVNLFDLNAYTSSANLGSPLLGIYITVEEGTATVSVAPTTAVDSMTLPEYTPTSSVPTPTQSSSGFRASILSVWLALPFLAGVAVIT